MPSDQADNDPVETYAALLIADDPTGQAAVAFHNVSDLTKAEFDRYSEAYDTLEDILVANMMAYFLTCAVAFATQGVLILISTSVTARRFAAALASTAAALTFGFGVTVAAAPTAGAYPGGECTYDQPYPDSPYDICTGFGQSCMRSLCSAAPGTEGKTDINGDYEPCMGSCSNPYD